MRRHSYRVVSSGHTVTILAFSNTKICDYEFDASRAARDFNTLLFSKSDLEMLFSIARRLDEFRYRQGSILAVLMSRRIFIRQAEGVDVKIARANP